MVDLTVDSLPRGHVFTAHVTGNLVLAAAAAGHGGPFDVTQTFAIPFFMLAVAAVWFIARASRQRAASLARLLLVVQCVLLLVRLRNGLSVRTASLGFAGSSLDGRHDWQLDRDRSFSDGSAVGGR